MNVPIQIDFRSDALPYNDANAFAYVCDDNPDMESFRNKLFKHLGC